VADFKAQLKRLLLASQAISYRVRQESRKLSCPHPDYLKASVTLPAEWLGKHAIAKDRAIKAFPGLDPDLTNFVVAMHIVDGFSNIPGLVGADPAQWKLEMVPIPIISWVNDAVLSDFLAAYSVPKNSSAPSPAE